MLARRSFATSLVALAMLGGCAAPSPVADAPISLQPGQMYITQVGVKPTTWAFLRGPHGNFRFYSAPIGKVPDLSKVTLASLGAPHGVVQGTLNLHGGVFFTSRQGSSFSFKKMPDGTLVGIASGHGFNQPGTFGPPIPVPGR